MSSFACRDYRLVALGGEGIGPEVVEACLTILQALAKTEGFRITVERSEIGEPARQKFGVSLPSKTINLCERADGILFGAVNQGGLLELRQHFDLFINLRPIRPLPSLFHLSPIKAERLQGVDLLFVRELASGIYFGPAGRNVDEKGAYGFHTMRYADAEIQRITRVALSYAQSRRKCLTVAHKENALPHLQWQELVQQQAQAFPDVTVDPMLVDNLAMQLVINPQQFDVILAGNLFGDILSDLGGAIVGSIGLAGSASLNNKGFGLYEAVHGTAPNLAGKGLANPLGTLAGVILMLQQWGEKRAAKRLSTIQETLLEKGYRTTDLAETTEMTITTQELVNLFLQAIHQPTNWDESN